MEKDKLLAALTNMRADLMATRLLMDAMLVAMTPAARAALQQNFETLSENAIAHGLAASTSPDDMVHAVERSIEHVKQRLAALPQSPPKP